MDIVEKWQEALKRKHVEWEPKRATKKNAHVIETLVAEYKKYRELSHAYIDWRLGDGDRLRTVFENNKKSPLILELLYHEWLFPLQFEFAKWEAWNIISFADKEAYDTLAGRQRAFLENPDKNLADIVMWAWVAVTMLAHGLPSERPSPYIVPRSAVLKNKAIDDFYAQLTKAARFADDNPLRHLSPFKHISDKLQEKFWQLGAAAEYRGNAVEAYLKDTFVYDYMNAPMTLPVTDEMRFEHAIITAASGHGKTQTFQYLLLHDLTRVLKGEASVVLIDSQNDLINNLSHCAMFAPLRDKLIIIDPTDIDHPIPLSLFSMGMARMSQHTALERERLRNSVVELLTFVLGSLLDAGMTAKQATIFNFIVRFLLVIPGATIHTFLEILQPDGVEKYREHLAKLTPTARQFFETEFGKAKQYAETKEQILRRLWGILENQTFERMFSCPTSRFDLYEEMNAGKVILINTAKDLLKAEGSKVFGRFFIAMLAQAAQERATIPKEKRLPTFVYIDEAGELFDDNIATILNTTRKYHVGITLAHQYLGQLSPHLFDSVSANTSIKLAGGLSAKDARTLAPMLRTTPEFIEAQKKGSFALLVRGVTEKAASFQVPFGVLENFPKLPDADYEAMRQAIRDKYAVCDEDPVQAPSAPTEPSPEPDVTEASETW